MSIIVSLHGKRNSISSLIQVPIGVWQLDWGFVCPKVSIVQPQEFLIALIFLVELQVSSVAGAYRFISYDIKYIEDITR